jgi:hypothetical protein
MGIESYILIQYITFLFCFQALQKDENFLFKQTLFSLIDSVKDLLETIENPNLLKELRFLLVFNYFKLL